MKAKAERGRTLRLVGIGLLLCSAYIYTLAVDRTWYAVDGITRIVAESKGLVRWRFIAHTLGLSNGGMRAQSWAFVVFPILFWTALSLISAATVVWLRSRRGEPLGQRVVARLRWRREVQTEQRRRSLNIVCISLGIAGAIAVAGIVTLRSAPTVRVLEDEQLTAGNWLMRFDEMRDGQQLMIQENHLGEGQFGDLVAPQEAAALVRQDRIDRARAKAAGEAECDSLHPDDPSARFDCNSIDASLGAEWKALSKGDVAARAVETAARWRDAVGSFDHTSIAGVVLCVLFIVLVGFALRLAPRVVAAEFRGFDPYAEDAWYSTYTRLGYALVGAAAVLAVVGIACSGGEQPGGIAVAILITMLVGAVGVLAIGQIFLAPRALARLRDPQLAAQSAVASHDRTTLAEIAKRDASAATKQQYVATLQAAASPPDLVANAQAELHAAQQAAAELRGRLLGPALQAATSRLQAASAQHFALRSQRAPAEAFGAVDGAIHSAKAEIAQLSASAGWSPWPVSPGESQTHEISPLVSVGEIIGAAALLAVVAAVAVLSRPHPVKASGSDSIVGTAETADARCDGVFDDYQRALVAARDSAGALETAGCATPSGDGSLVPPAQLSPRCESLWTTHFANVQHAIDINGQARAACPTMNIPSMGTVPPSLRISPNTVANSPQPEPAAPLPPTPASAPRYDFTADGVSLSAIIPTGAAPAGDGRAKGAIRANVTWPSLPNTPDVYITDSQGVACGEDAQLSKAVPPGVRVEQHESGDRELFYFKNPDGSYSATVCTTSIGYHCAFDSVPAAIALDALDVCRSVQRVGKAQVMPVGEPDDAAAVGSSPPGPSRSPVKSALPPSASVPPPAPLPPSPVPAPSPAPPAPVPAPAPSAIPPDAAVAAPPPAPTDAAPARARGIADPWDNPAADRGQPTPPDCSQKLVEPKNPACQTQFCKSHATDPACSLE